MACCEVQSRDGSRDQRGVCDIAFAWQEDIYECVISRTGGEQSFTWDGKEKDGFWTGSSLRVCTNGLVLW